ncbi:hypothetical protein F4801DRAFT_344047 [Xylaria longipes]|nr:hypothetical protein F4801DRAFT_344047 [Xylaria longipes]
MPQNTRSRRRVLQPAPPLPCRQTRRHNAPESSTQEGNPQRGEQGSIREPSHTSAVFLLPEISPELSDDEPEPETLSTPTPTGPCGVPIPPKRQGEIKNPFNNTWPDLGLQDAHEPTAPQGVEYEPRHVQIVHFDFSKYRPSTPGSKTHPIKIEDSPKACSSLPVHTRKVSIYQEPLTLPALHPKESAIRHDYQSGDASQVVDDHADGSSFMILPADLVLSEGVTSIITSPKAATLFLHCFLASEKYWLKSLDHDMDPDVKFWKNIVKRFNADPHGYSINAWLTARAIATTLCSQPYKAQVEQQLPGVGGELSTLISAIEDCRRMSQRRRWGQRSGFENVKTFVGGMAVGQDVRKGVLGRKPQTLEDQKKLLQTLATVCAESTHTTAPKIDNPKVGPGLNNQNKRERAHLQPHAADISTRDDTNVPKGPRNNLHAPGVIRGKPGKRFKTWRNNRPPERYPYHPPMGKERGDWRGDSSSSRYTAQDKYHLEQRVRELERTIHGMKRPRYSY